MKYLIFAGILSLVSFSSLASSDRRIVSFEFKIIERDGQVTERYTETYMKRENKKTFAERVLFDQPINLDGFDQVRSKDIGFSLSVTPLLYENDRMLASIMITDTELMDIDSLNLGEGDIFDTPRISSSTLLFTVRSKLGKETYLGQMNDKRYYLKME